MVTHAMRPPYFKMRRDNDDWMLHPQLFLQVKDLWESTRNRKVTVDVAASPTNAQLPRYCSKDQSFFKANVAGEVLYCNPPFRQIKAFVDRYLHLKSQDPNTHMVLITPHTPISPWWQLVNKHFTLAKIIPKEWRADGAAPGAGKLFTRPIQQGNNDRVYPCDYDETREYTRSGLTDVCVWFSINTHKFIPNVQYHEPTQQYTKLSKAALTTLHGMIHGVNVSVLVDSGAQVNMINNSLVKHLKLPSKPSNVQLKWIDDSLKSGNHSVTNMDLLLNGQSFNLDETIVCDLATYDIILGVPFLDNTQAILSHRNGRTISLYNKEGQEVTLHSTSHRSQDDVSYIVSYVEAVKALKRDEGELFVLHVKHDSDTNPSEDNTPVTTKTKKSLEECIHPSCPPEIKVKLLDLLNKYKSVFESPTLTTMNQDVKVELHLKEDAVPYAATPYKITDVEKQALKEILDRWMARGWIIPGRGGWGAPILLLKKKMGGYRLVCDYRALNHALHNESWPLPRIDAILDKLTGAEVFSKFDLDAGYHQLQLATSSQHVTAFVCPLGQFSWTVLPQGLKTAPSIFSKHLDHIFQAHKRDNTTTNYLDDVLVYTKWDQHLVALEKVLKTMQDNRLFADINKCVFHANQIDFLGHEITPKGIGPEKVKLQAIQSWPVPTSFDQAHQFLGLCAWFRRFIPKFSEVSAGLQEVVNAKGKCEFHEAWGDEALKSFTTLQEYMCHTGTVMQGFQPGLPTVVWTDASEYAVGSILMQQHNNAWHPVAYMSSRLNQSQLHWMTTEKEMYSILKSLEQWSHYLRGHSKFLICTDHKSLVIKPTTKVAVLRIKRWLAKLSTYDYVIMHKPGIANQIADSLSRRPDYLAWFKLYMDTSPSLKCTHQDVGVQTDVLSVESDPVQVSAVITATFPSSLLESIKSSYQGVDLDNVEVPLTCHDGLYYTPAAQIYLPTTQIQHLCTHHIHSTYFHAGISKTIAAMKRLFWFPHLKQVITEVLRGCQICQQVKTIRRRSVVKGSVVQQVALKGKKLDSIMLDFIWGLNAINGYTGLLVIVDLFSKLCQAIPVKSSITSSQTASLLVTHWVSHYGIPSTVYSDQDIRFVSETWAEVLGSFGSKPQLSSPYHPQTQGAVEVLNGLICTCLRSALLELHTHDWTTVVPWVVYAINSLQHTAHSLSPHEIVFGCSFPLLPGTDLANASLTGDQLKQLTELCRQRLLLSGVQEPEHANTWHPQAGEQVWLSTKCLQLKKGAGKKLLPRFIGPFPIEQSYGHSCKLKLPDSMLCRRTWNVQYLKQFIPNESGYARVASDWAIGPGDIIDEDQSQVEAQQADIHTEAMQVDESVVTDIHFHKSTRKGRLFRVQFNHDWNNCAFYHEHDLASLPNGVAVHKQWIAAHQR